MTSNIYAGGKVYNTLNEKTRTLSFLPWAHAYGHTAELHFIMSIGGSTGIAENTKTIPEDLLSIKPTFLVAVPRVFKVFYNKILSSLEERDFITRKLFKMGIEASTRRKSYLKTDKTNLVNDLKLKVIDILIFSRIRSKFGGRLEACLSSGAALNTSIAKFFENIGIPVYEAWGMTELSPAATMNSPEKNKLGSVGLPLDKVTISIDKTLFENQSQEGELIVYGPNVMKGYHNRPRETADIMTKDGGIRTGDKAVIDKEGYLFITGRISEEFKLENGKFVHPIAIEEAIETLPFVENAVIFGLNKPYTVCLILPNPDVFTTLYDMTFPDYAKKEIENHLKDKFPNYEIPKRVILIDENFTVENGLLTQTLKIKRQKIIDKYSTLINKTYIS